MKLFYLFGHPSQFYFHKYSIDILKEKGHELFLYIKSKDVLESLIQQSGFIYKNIQPFQRKSNKLSIVKALINRDFKLSKEIIKYKPDLLISSDPSFSQLGFFFKIPSINFIDDDIKAIGFYPYITYPFTRHIVTPSGVDVGRFHHKRTEYEGYMKLSYLHPNRFTPDPEKLGIFKNKSFSIIRLSKLQAHHDTGAKGINEQMLYRIIKKLSDFGEVIITSEYILNSTFRQYQYNLPKLYIHHFLAFANILVSDSQSMTGEASMLGIPSIRINTFAAKLNVLNELEKKYGLTYAFNPDDFEECLKKIDEIFSLNDLCKIFKNRRDIMLRDKIDVTSYITWLIDCFPESFEIMNYNPDYQYNFR